VRDTHPQTHTHTHTPHTLRETHKLTQMQERHKHTETHTEKPTLSKRHIQPDRQTHINPDTLIDIYRTFHHKTMNFTFFSSAHGTFFRIDHILGQKYSLGKFKKIEIISSIFSDYNVVRLDANYRKKLLKIQTYGG